jgi:hypothetical protein
MRSLLLFICFLSTFQAVQAQQVLFGERNTLFTKNALYFDKDGFCYPSLFIPDSSLQQCGNSLCNWYRSNHQICDSLFKRFQIIPTATEVNSPSFESLQQLNDSIIAENIAFLNKDLNSNSGVTLVVHGFRKSYFPTEKDVSSIQEYDLLLSEFSRYGYSRRSLLFIFWDGMYDCCFSLNPKKNKSLFQLFQTAVEQSLKVGKSVAKVVDLLKTKDVALLGHSLGSQIVSTAALSTTNLEKHLRVGLIAPAMTARYIQNQYTQSPKHASIDWMVLYNEADFVLHKKDNKLGIFGPGPKRYGRTTFGCNYRNEATKWKQWMSHNVANGTATIIDKTDLSKCHSLRCYTQQDELKEIWIFFEN